MSIDASSTFRTPSHSTEPNFEPVICASIHDDLEFWQYMIAGSIAGSVEHMTMFPVDTLKTRMQICTSSFSVNPVGVRQALGSILKLEGPSSLYRGIGAMGLGAGLAHAVYFSVYEFFKEYFTHGNPSNSAAHVVSGVCAMVASNAVITPMDMVKHRLSE